MKREQKAFAMLMAACMAFAGISTVSTASADSVYPVSFTQSELGNYLPEEEEEVKEAPKKIVLPSGRSVVKKSEQTSSKTSPKISIAKSKEEDTKTNKRKVIKLNKNFGKTNQNKVVLSLNTAD